jgi:hypothetical protein
MQRKRPELFWERTVNVKYSYDEKCLDLARHFYPMQSIAFLEALAQTIQDCVEGREEIPSEPTPRYQCMVEGCPINHVSKRDVCSTVETSPAPEPAPAGCEDWWHLRPYGYAPGKYTMKCPHCQVSVWDVDKRASCCKPCAIAFYESAQSEVNR